MIISNLPNSEKPSYYEKVSETCGMKEWVLKSLRMRSRSYFAKPIRSQSGRTSGVTVVESVQRQGVDEEPTRNILESENLFLSVIVESMNEFGVKLAKRRSRNGQADGTN